MKVQFILSFFLILFHSISIFGSNNCWIEIEKTSENVSINNGETAFHRNTGHPIAVTNYKIFTLDRAQIEEKLKEAPLEFHRKRGETPAVIELPLANGQLESFLVEETEVLQKSLARKYPNIKTYTGKGLNNSSLKVRFDLNSKGFNGMIYGVGSTIFIDPITSDDGSDRCMVYFKNDFNNIHSIPECLTKENEHFISPTTNRRAESSLGEELRVYKIAIACRANYTAFHGGVESAMEAVVTAMNRVIGVYRRDLAISFVIVDNNDQLIFSGTDDYPVSSDDILNYNQQLLDNIIGTENYDIGHIFAAGGGGFTKIAGVCDVAIKAKGHTGLSNPSGDPFYIDYLCHEIGHQFGADHTYNSLVGFCGSQRVAANAYEPGSGSTIMAYTGICGADNLQENSDDYFHTASQNQIIFYSGTGGGNDCAEIMQIGNQPPEISLAEQSFNIPINTPFELEAIATDPDGETMTYCWEQYDTAQPGGSPNSPVGNAPIFRSFPPTTNPVRTFPQMSDILNNVQTLGEILPAYTRNILFRLTVRDNNEICGGVSSDFVILGVNEDSGPFAITSQNETEEWLTGEDVNITWDPAGTESGPINCSNVDLFYSADGGQNFDLVLAQGIPNNGLATLTLPNNQNIVGENGRIKIKCSDNIFFDINDANIVVNNPHIALSFAEDLSICEGETVNFDLNLELMNVEAGTAELESSNLPEGWSLQISDNPVAAPGQTSVSITVPDGAELGANYFTIESSDNPVVLPLEVQVNVLSNDANIVGPELLSPENGSSNLNNGHLFDWEDLAGVQTYDLEINGFDEQFESGELTNSEYVANFEFQTSHVYWWNVNSYNDCLGESAPISSDVFVFRMFGNNIGFAPLLLETDEFLVDQFSEKTIDDNYLNIEDDNADSEIFYLIKTIPEYGKLILEGVNIEPGDLMSHNQVKNGQLVYEHSSASQISEDQFEFDLLDIDNGWLKNQVFDIDINIISALESAVELGFDFAVYPNPANNYLLIQTNFEKPELLEFELINSTGQVVSKSLRQEVQSGLNEIKLNVNNLESALYFYRLKKGDQIIEGKVLIIH